MFLFQQLATGNVMCDLVRGDQTLKLSYFKYDIKIHLWFGRPSYFVFNVCGKLKKKDEKNRFKSLLRLTLVI